MPTGGSNRSRKNARPLPSDRDLLIGWAIRAVAGCILFGGVTTIVRGDPVTVRNVVGYGVLFGVLVATLHFVAALWERRRAGRSSRE